MSLIIKYIRLIKNYLLGMSNKKNIVYFLNGSIGDFLMVLFLMKVINEQSGGNYNLYISTPRLAEEFKKLSVLYPFVSVIGQKPRQLFFLFGKNNYCILPPTTGKNPWHIKIMAFFFGKVISFDDGSVLDKFIFYKILPFNTKVLFIEMLLSLLPVLKLKEIKTDLKLEFRGEKFISQKPYILFHPFGSNAGRSILGDKLCSVCFILRKYFPDHQIMISGSLKDLEQLPLIDVSDVVSVPKNLSAIVDRVDVINNADFFVGVDTGITHLASVLQKESIILAENGTPHWLPYYNKNSLIVFHVEGDESGAYQGRDYLESRKGDGVRCLGKIPLSIIEEAVKNFANEKR